MDLNGLQRRLIDGGVPADRLLTDEPMSRHTTFRVGGRADLFLNAASGEEIALAVNAADEYGASYIIIGNGSNLIVRDDGVRGLVIHIGDHMASIEADGETLICGAGCLMSRISAECLRLRLSGFEALGGIPGTLGGAVAMNAGAYGSELKDVLVSATVLDQGQVRIYGVNELNMRYRGSLVQDCGMVVLSARLKLHSGDEAAIKAACDDYAARRKAKQPLNFPSAGSTFKRPEGYFAGALIEECGLKGTKVGGAQVSTLHAGFVINAGGATASDILALIDLIRLKVRMSSGVELEPEVKIVGSDDA